jgi:hypothetical protein
MTQRAASCQINVGLSKINVNVLTTTG